LREDEQSPNFYDFKFSPSSPISPSHSEAPIFPSLSELGISPPSSSPSSPVEAPSLPLPAPLPPFSVILRGADGDTEWTNSSLLPPGLNSSSMYPVDLHSLPFIQKGAPPPVSDSCFFTYYDDGRFVLVYPI
jgi:hypothetical protein